MSPADRGTDPATILLIEDHEDTREMYVAILESAGYSVLGVAAIHRAPEAVRVIHADLVIIDLGMQNDGLAVASQLATMPKPPKLIALTGRPRQGGPAERVFVEYLEKPVLPDDLVAAVRRVLEA